MQQMAERIMESEKHLREEMKLKVHVYYEFRKCLQDWICQEQEAINLHQKNFEDWKEAEKKKMMVQKIIFAKF